MIERSTDVDVIKALATHPAIFCDATDDWFPDPEAWRPTISDNVVYLLAKNEKGYFGFGAFIADTWTCWKAHVGFLPESYGAIAVAAFREMLEYMWEHTRARRIVGEIADENRRAITFAVNAGFERYGVNVKSKLVGGELRDQVCLGISRP